MNGKRLDISIKFGMQNSSLFDANLYRILENNNTTVSRRAIMTHYALLNKWYVEEIMRH
jgi:hypothetical protein